MPFRFVLHPFTLHHQLQQLSSQNFFSWDFNPLPKSPPDTINVQVYVVGTEKLQLNLPSCFFLALSHMAGLRDTLPPLSRTQVLLQTRTPRQDFLRMLTLWLLVLRIAHPLECLRASSHSAGYTKRQCPSGQSCQSSCSAICKETKENTVTFTQYRCHRSKINVKRR